MRDGRFAQSCFPSQTDPKSAMRKVNLSDVTEHERKSPKGKYHARLKEISLALGRDRDSLDLTKRHPFDLALLHIPAGGTLCPYHAHSAQSELYLVISGRGQVRHEGGMTEVGTGDAFFFGPGEAHQISNPGPDELSYYVIADNPIGESCYYPDNKKWAVFRPPDNIMMKGSETNYFEGEE
jgi:uncharacterized cupin superfamily protein